MWCKLSLFLLCCLGTGFCQREEPQFLITCGMLDGQLLPGDKDEINLSESQDDCIADDEVIFELSFGLRVSRWKGVRLSRFDNYEDFFPLLELNCRNCNHMVRFKRSMLVDYGMVTLWKNELVEIGEQAHYGINDTISCFQPGLKYTFDWVTDGFPVALKEEDEEVETTF